jgi:cell division protein FtsI (penicillin-binding protein 3)
VIISHPQSGEILAMSHYPAFDPNNPPVSFQKEERIKGIHHIYDPGSTFKIITASAALESSRVALSDTFDCSSRTLALAGKRFTDHKSFGLLTFPEVISHSSNIGTIQIGQRIGKKKLYETAHKFGFGQRTGIDLPAEERGIFRAPKHWTNISVASISIGYEISVTALQILHALNVIANDGMSIHPRLVKEIINSPPTIERGLPRQKRIISRDTARLIASILEEAVRSGTGTNAGIQGYIIAGKTGTAQKFDPAEKQYSSEAHTSSFVGYAAGEDILFSMIVVLDNPKGEFYGGKVAAPVFRSIAGRILRYFMIPPKIKQSETVTAAGLGKAAPG